MPQCFVLHTKLQQLSVKTKAISLKPRLDFALAECIALVLANLIISRGEELILVTERSPS